MRNLRILGLVTIFLAVAILPGFVPDGFQSIKAISTDESCDWPSFGRTPDGNRVAPDGNGPKSAWPGKLWDFKTESIVETTQIIYENRVYISASDNLYCLDINTGKEIWKFSTPLGSWTPTIWDNKIYFGTHKSVTCVDIDTGIRNWEFQTDNYIQSVPTVDDGLLYIGSEDDHLYCLDPTTGKELWKFKADSSVTSNPLIIGDLLVFHSSNYLYCISKENCDIKWKKRMSAGLFNTPVYYKQKIYTGCAEGYLYCINLEDGKTGWELNVQLGIFDSSAVWNDNVYFGRQDGMFYCVDANDGKIRWNYKAGTSVTAPAICDKRVYFSSNDKNLYCLDAVKGTFLWAYQTGHAVWSAPTIANNKIVFGSFDHKVYCLGDITDLPDRRKPVRIDIFFGHPNVFIHSTRQIQAHVVNKYNEILDGYSFDWTVDPDYGQITENNLFIPKKIGNVSINCKSGILESQMEISIGVEPEEQYVFLDIIPGERLTKSFHIFNDLNKKVIIKLTSLRSDLIEVTTQSIEIEPFHGINIDITSKYIGTEEIDTIFTIVMDYTTEDGKTNFTRTIQGFIRTSR